MKLLLKQALIADRHSPYNGQVKDILIADGTIEKIEDHLDAEVDQLIETEGLTVSPGWVDIFAHFNDPGYEFKETLESGANAAAAGGFTNVFLIPNSNPVVSNKAQVEYIVQKAKGFSVTLLPLGSITKNADGKELAEMYDMRNSGAVAFTDGTNAVQTSGLLLKALQYVKACNGVLIQIPVDNSIGQHGLMNEGIISTQMGLPGIPAIAEEIIISRDIELLRYTQSKLHITGISTSKGIELIRAAKISGINITCSVTPYHLFFCDEDLQQYDTNLKVNPPLRSRSDMMALRQAVMDGVIDCIVSHHLPHDWDNKTCEFEYAKYGMIGLESSYSVFNTLFPHMPIEQVTDLFSSKARKIFNLPQPSIDLNNQADITLFDRSSKYIFDNSCIKSKSKNTPFTGRELSGKVIGIINKESLYLND